MTKIIKEGGKTIIQTGARIDTMNANQFEEDILLNTLSLT